MSLYLSPDALSEAVERLSGSRARPVLCDFLVLKYAMELGDGTVTLSMRDETYMTAVRRLASAAPPSESVSTPEPYFIPFGASRETRQGWRTKKYPSNGPPDTVNGPNWTAVIEVLSRGPRRVQFTSDYVDHLPGVVVGSDGDYPLAQDVASWFFRFEDIELLVGSSPAEDALLAPFESQVGLTSGEKAVIFGPKP